MLLQNKKGIEAMVAYVLLVVIAISISVLVYGFLKFYAPKDQPSCDTDLQLSIDKVTCQGNNLEITLSNRGFFTIDRFQLRIGEEDRIAKTMLNEGSAFTFQGQYALNGLPPGESWTGNYNYEYSGLQTREIEVQPAQVIDKDIILCEQVIKRVVKCS